MSKIRIQSTTTIAVTPGLQHTNLTKMDSDIPNRMKVAPEWPRKCVQILQGVGEYPSEIIDWPSVKALVKDKILTISAITEEEEKEEEVVKTPKTKKKTLEEAVGD